MKKTTTYIALLILFISTLSCKKDTEVIDPDYTKGLTGRYNMTYYKDSYVTLNLPSDGYSGTFDNTRIDNTHLSFLARVLVNGKVEDSSTVEAELRRVSANNFDLYDGTTKVGSITPTSILIQDTSPNGVQNVIRASR